MTEETTPGRVLYEALYEGSRDPWPWKSASVADRRRFEAAAEKLLNRFSSFPSHRGTDAIEDGLRRDRAAALLAQDQE